MQVRATPDTIALVEGDCAVSYSELNHIAGHLAQILQANGIGPDRLVALCMEPGIKLIASILAVLKTGGAYLPLSTDFPSDQIASLLERAGVDLVVTHNGLLNETLAPKSKVLDLSDEDVTAFGFEEKLYVTTSPQNLANVIYTSGSTGFPKAVGIPHEALGLRAAALGESSGLNHGDRILQFLSPAFDAFGEEVFPTLMRGATLVIANAKTGRLSPSEYLSLVKAHAITVLHLPAAYWTQLVQHLETEDAQAPSSVRLTNIGGEKVSRANAVAWLRRCAQHSRINHQYGPTETVITATMTEFNLETVLEVDEPYLPIGRPVKNTEVYVLGPNLDVLPPGIPGDLFISGDCLARGYLNFPDMTAALFFAEPLQLGARLSHVPNRRPGMVVSGAPA